MKSFPSNHALKPLIPTFCLVVLMIYGQADKLRNFVAGIFIPQYRYPYPVALCFSQVVVSLVFLNLLHVLGLVPLKRYSRPLGERLLLPALCNSVQAVLVMWTRASTSYGGFFLFIMPLLPLVTVGFSFVLKVTSPPSSHSTALISMLTGMFIIFSGKSYNNIQVKKGILHVSSSQSSLSTASKGISCTEPLEFMYALLALILQSIYLLVLAKVYETEHHQPHEAQASYFDIFYTQLVNQSGVLGLLWLLHPDSPWHVLRHSSWQNLLFHGYLLAILLLGMVLNFLVCISALCVSPFAAAMLYSSRQMVQPFLQLL
uniref:Si:ch211-207n2.7 n=2 Tax=Nothobranchius TaxID=28779 RepID=A0A8C6LWV6_NOTFU